LNDGFIQRFVEAGAIYFLPVLNINRCGQYIVADGHADLCFATCRCDKKPRHFNIDSRKFYDLPDTGLKYHDSIADTVVDLGKPDEIGRVFAGFQKYLYQESAVAALV
jgi:hypothetical protein